MRKAGEPWRLPAKARAMGLEPPNHRIDSPAPCPIDPEENDDFPNGGGSGVALEPEMGASDPSLFWVSNCDGRAQIEEGERGARTTMVAHHWILNRRSTLPSTPVRYRKDAFFRVKRHPASSFISTTWQRVATELSVNCARAFSGGRESRRHIPPKGPRRKAKRLAKRPGEMPDPAGRNSLHEFSTRRVRPSVRPGKAKWSRGIPG